MAFEQFFGAWAPPETVRRLKALAALRGTSQSEVLRGLVNEAAARAVSGLEEIPGDSSPAAEMSDRDAMELEAQRAAVTE